VRAGRLRRSDVAGRFLYTADDSRQARDQLRTRQTAQSVVFGDSRNRDTTRPERKRNARATPSHATAGLAKHLSSAISCPSLFHACTVPNAYSEANRDRISDQLCTCTISVSDNLVDALFADRLRRRLRTGTCWRAKEIWEDRGGRAPTASPRKSSRGREPRADPPTEAASTGSRPYQRSNTFRHRL
jgi:hypothetical protein